MGEGERGRFPGYDVLNKRRTPSWNQQTREAQNLVPASGRGSASLPLVTRFTVHWCSGTACCPVEAEVRDRHP